MRNVEADKITAKTKTKLRHENLPSWIHSKMGQSTKTATATRRRTKTRDKTRRHEKRLLDP